MDFKVEDQVRIKSKDLIGSIRDIQKYKDGPEVAIVECEEESGEGEYTHRVLSVDTKDLEKC